jgi:hypothetical protein
MERETARRDAQQRAAVEVPPSTHELPEDILAEEDAEERRAGREPPAPAGLVDEVPEEVLAERDAEARLADLRETDDRVVELEEP